MLEALGPLNDKWHEPCGFSLSIGIGVNSGNARVGNAGSRRRMKYGPLGHTVNLASRLEGVTKTLSVPVLITEATRAQLTNTDRTRRLGRVLAVGMESPVAAYEYRIAESSPNENGDWLSMRDEFEKALNSYESRDLSEARSIAENIVGSPLGQDDQPTKFLLQRIAEAESVSAEAFDPILHMKSK